MGKINVTKYVQNLQGKQAPENDIFSVLIKGNDSQYNLSLKSGDSNKQTMEFILKGNNEYNDDIYKQAYDTSNFADIVQVDNYATVKIGNYNVDELVPMNYTKTSTKISTNANSNKVETDNFILDKDNNIIDIQITNKYVNDIYFFDKIIKSNIFKFLKIS